VKGGLVGAVSFAGLDDLGSGLFGVFDVGLFGGFFELLDGLAETFGEVGEFFGSEQEDDDGEDEHELHRTKAKDRENRSEETVHDRRSVSLCGG
jgi:hypothetical protein